MADIIFSNRDVEALKLLRWCQYIELSELSRLFTETEINNLVCAGLIKEHKSSGALVLTSDGCALLRSGTGCRLPELTQSYHRDAIVRRTRIARFVTTARLARIDAFTLEPEDISSPPSVFLTAITRGRGQNPWGSSRVAAIAHLGGIVCAVHFVCPGIGALRLEDELATFHNHTAKLGDKRRAFLFAGDSYADILQELSNISIPDTRRSVSYGGAYRQLQMPVYLLPCDNTGVVQLRILSTADYRKRLTMAALGDSYEPAPRDIPEWDAIFDGLPFVMAADMELRRVDAAASAARERGIDRIAIAALEAQAEQVFFSRYRDTGQARVFTLTEGALSGVIGGLEPYSPSRKQFLTERGEVVDAPLIQAHRKARGKIGK